METLSLASRLTEARAKPPKAAGLSGDQDLMEMIREIRDNEQLYAATGAALMRTPLFQSGELSLYCGVPVKYLLPEGAPSWNEYLDFVICRGQEAVMGLYLMKPEYSSEETLLQFQEAGIPPEFVETFQSASFDDPQWFAASVAAPTISQSLRADGPRMESTLRPIPAKLLKKLSVPAMRVLTVRKVGGQKFWFPTEFGRSLGILQGFRTDRNHCVRPVLCCGEGDLEQLERTVSWADRSGSFQPSEQYALSQRVGMAGRGMTTCPSAMMDLVRRFGEMPLTEYFRNDPAGLTALKSRFPEVDSLPFQQAALRIACTSQREAAEPGSSPLEILAGPLAKRKDLPLASKPVRGVLFAASLLANSRYLTWAGEVLFHDHDCFHVAENWSYRKWLQWVMMRIREEKGKSPMNTDLLHDFYGILRLLIIAPFVLMEQRTST